MNLCILQTTLNWNFHLVWPVIGLNYPDSFANIVGCQIYSLLSHRNVRSYWKLLFLQLMIQNWCCTILLHELQLIRTAVKHLPSFSAKVVEGLHTWAKSKCLLFKSDISDWRMMTLTFDDGKTYKLVFCWHLLFLVREI